MASDPDESSNDETPEEKILGAPERIIEKAGELRMHAELAAVFEGTRKFDARVKPRLDADLARDVQRKIGKLEKSVVPNTPIIEPESAPIAAELLAIPETKNLSTNDYHVHRRPGEAMVIRWLAGDEVETFYERLQAHFDAGLAAHREEERANNEWKQDPKTLAYLELLDKLELSLAERYLREPIKTHNVFVLSTVTADEMNIAFLTGYIMQIDPAELVGEASAPPDPPTDQDLAWFFKLFLLRGVVDGVERMCFFTFLQKSDDNSW
jgi:hypothetical protein